VSGWIEVALVALAATAASLVFAAATLGWFRTRCRWWEIGALLLATFALFRPNYFMDRLYAPYTEVPAGEILKVAEKLPENARLVLVIEGTTLEGDELRKTVAVQLTEPGPAAKRLAEAGAPLGLRAGLPGGRREGAHRSALRALDLPAGARAGGLRLAHAGPPRARLGRERSPGSVPLSSAWSFTPSACR